MNTRLPIRWWQVVILLLLGCLSYIECIPDFESFFFPVIFLLTLWGMLRHRRILPLSWLEKIKQWTVPATIRLRLLNIRMIRGKALEANHEEPCTCLCCGEEYTGNYCPRCGQSRKTSRYRLRNALQNIASGFFNIDTGFGRTMIDLLHRPGYMMRDFIAGQRAPQFRPFQMLFILAALYIMMVQLVDPEALNRKEQPKQVNREEVLSEVERALQEEATDRTDSLTLVLVQQLLEEEEEDESSFGSDMAEAGMAIGNAIEEQLDDSPYLQRVYGLLKSWTHGNKAFRIIATLPLFALASLFAFRRRFRPHYNLTEHLFIQAYMACQTLLISILVLPFNGHARVDELYDIPLWLIFLLFWIDYKQLYHTSWWNSFWGTWRMVAYSLLILVSLAALIVAIGLLVANLL